MKLPLKSFVVGLLCVCMTLSGCALWMDGEYAYVSPNNPKADSVSEETVVVKTYDELRNALIDFVEAGVQSDVLYVTGMTEGLLGIFMNRAIDEVQSVHPMGAYAVDKITFEAGSNLGRRAVSVNISYNHNRSEILRIKEAKNMDEALGLIRLALVNYEASTVLRVNNYVDKDLTQFVEDYVLYNPQLCMEMPQVSVSTFPEIGTERVVEIFFTYQTSRETLRSMQQSVSDIFKSAKFYVDANAENVEKYSQLYSFLMERYSYKEETALTPPYSLLRHGVGDDRAFASVYSAMCRQVGLDCDMISGTKNGEAWHWNVIKEGDVYYYIDLLECKETGGFAMKTVEEMSTYVWDYSAS